MTKKIDHHLWMFPQGELFLLGGCFFEFLQLYWIFKPSRYVFCFGKYLNNFSNIMKEKVEMTSEFFQEFDQNSADIAL